MTDIETEWMKITAMSSIIFPSFHTGLKANTTISLLIPVTNVNTNKVMSPHLVYIHNRTTIASADNVYILSVFTFLVSF